MGVINNFDNVNRSRDDEWIYLTSDGEEGTVVTGANDESARIQVPARRNPRLSRKSTKPEPTFMALGVKGKSHKKFRRYANANLLANELGNFVNESELEEISINDFIPQTPSPFSMLLATLDNGGFDLNDFINCTEEEQVDMIGRDIQLEHCSINKDDDDSSGCFLRIKPHMRRQLLKKQPPIGLLSSIENTIIEFFQDNPQSIYETSIGCSYRRFLLHACCQYLNLNCQSFTFKGKRLSFVKNKKKKFTQPLQLLSEYLEVIR